LRLRPTAHNWEVWVAWHEGIEAIFSFWSWCWVAGCRCAVPGSRDRPIQRCLLLARLVDVGSIGSCFESLSGPRHMRKRKHLTVDIAIIAIRECEGPIAI